MKATKALSTTFTYTLGKSLYVPLTSKCTSLTLPQTRGPNFLLPNSVISSLLHVRSVEEQQQQQQQQQVSQSQLSNDFYLSNEEEEDRSNSLGGRSRLPSPIFPKVDLDVMEVAFDADADLVNLRGETKNQNGSYYHPTSSELLGEIKQKTIIAATTTTVKNDLLPDEQQCLDSSSDIVESIVFAGEGEPTLRLGAILHIARKIRAGSRKQYPMRVVTNGIPLAVMLAKEKHYNSQMNINMNSLSEVKDAGIDELSIALMTSCPQQYMELMQPSITMARIFFSEEKHDHNQEESQSYPAPPPPLHIHDALCDMIRDATQFGFDVELTGVDHDFVDKTKANDLAQELGVRKPFRWRPFFP